MAALDAEQMNKYLYAPLSNRSRRSTLILGITDDLAAV